jgi:hypothetical protein
MSPTLYGANRVVFANAIACPRSKTSGAVLLPFCWLAALISSWLLASGCAEFTLMPYFRGEGVDDLLVVCPIRRQRNHIELAFGLRGLDQAVHPAEVGRRGGLPGVHTGLCLVAGVLLLGGSAPHQSNDDEGGRGCGCEEP